MSLALLIRSFSPLSLYFTMYYFVAIINIKKERINYGCLLLPLLALFDVAVFRVATTKSVHESAYAATLFEVVIRRARLAILVIVRLDYLLDPHDLLARRDLRQGTVVVGRDLGDDVSSRAVDRPRHMG